MESIKAQEEFTTNQDDNQKEQPIQTTTQKASQIHNTKQSSVIKSDFVDDLEVSVVGFDKDLAFFSSESQIFNIQLMSLSRKQVWVINKRYSQIKWLHDILTVIHVGYIIPFLPSIQQVQEFITNKKLARNRPQMIEYKISLITQFLTSVYNHQVLKSCEEAKVFALKNYEKFDNEKSKLERIVQQYHQLQNEGSTFIYMLENASYFLWNYIGGEQQQQRLLSKEDVQFEIQQKKIELSLDSVKKLKMHMEELVRLKIQESQTKKLKGDWGKMQTVNCTIEQSRGYNYELSTEIETSPLRKVSFLVLQIEQVVLKLSHRKRLIKFYFSLSESIDDVERLGKLTARIKLLENYFRESYPAFKMYLEKEKSKIAAEFTKMWAVYRKQMKNVWK